MYKTYTLESTKCSWKKLKIKSNGKTSYARVLGNLILSKLWDSQGDLQISCSPHQKYGLLFFFLQKYISLSQNQNGNER